MPKQKDVRNYCTIEYELADINLDHYSGKRQTLKCKL